MESTESLIALVRANEDRSHHGDGCPKATIREAEAHLGVLLPPSWRRPLSEFGTWGLTGFETLGIFRSQDGPDGLLGAVRSTLGARKALGVPTSGVVVVDDDLGEIILDTSEPDADGEAPVLAWTPDGQVERLGDSFGEYAYAAVLSAVRAERGPRA